MTQAVVIQLREEVRALQTHGAYHQLVLLVGPPRGGKTTGLRALAKELSWPMVNLNLELAERLLEEPARFRQIHLLDRVRAIVDHHGDSPVIIDNIELLFQRDLQQDPLQVLLAAARSRVVVAAWPGDYDDGTLSYAVPGHPEHRRYPHPECALVPIETPFAPTQAAPQG